jgi:hypothetical protein
VPLELEGEYINLPHRIRHCPLETTNLRRTAFRLRRRVTETGVVDDSADGLRADVERFVASQFVTDPTDAVLWVLLPVLDDSLGQRVADLSGRLRSWASRQALRTALTPCAAPVVDRRL